MPVVSGFVVLQCVVSLAVVVVCCVALGQHRVPRALSFILLALCVSIISIGYLLEITSTAPDSAVLALRLQYLGLPFAGVCSFFFACDYCGVPLRDRLIIPALLAFPLVVLLVVLAWPSLPLLFREVAFTTAGGFPHLEVTPGPLYLLNGIYGYLLFLAGYVRVGVRFLHRASPYTLRHLLVVLAVAVPVAVCQVLQLLRPSIFSGFNTMPLAFALATTSMCVILVRYHFPKWRLQERGTVLQHAGDAYILLDADRRLLDANARAAEYFPSLKDLAPGAQPPDMADIAKQLIPDGATPGDLSLDWKDGAPAVHLRVSRSTLTYKGRPAGTACLLFDVSEIWQQIEDLQQLATLDSLTGINNRGTFFTQVQRDFDLSLRKNEPASLLMMDIDHFKQVNDEYGHLGGDQVLITIAKILQVRLRHTDVMGRYGGEEIAVWLPGATTDGASLIADVIRRALEHTPFESEKGRFHVTISIGVAGLDVSRHHSLEALISDADNALYAAKEAGRNQVVIFRPPPADDE